MIPEAVRRVYYPLFEAVRNFGKDQGAFISAGVSFYVLLSMGPLTYVLAMVLDFVFRDTNALATVLSAVESVAPEQAYPGVERMTQLLRLDGELALIALPGLLWAGTTAFANFEKAVNVAFGTFRDRTVWRSRLSGFALLLAASVLLAIFSVVGTLLPRLGQSMRGVFGLAPTPGLLDLVSSLTSPVLTYVSFVALYRWLPATGVAWRPALLGGLLAVTLWQGALRVLAAILARSPAAGLVVGTLTGTMAFFIWVYGTVMLSLLGAELVAVLNGNRRSERSSGRT